MDKFILFALYFGGSMIIAVCIQNLTYNFFIVVCFIIQYTILIIAISISVKIISCKQFKKLFCDVEPKSTNKIHESRELRN